VQVDPYYVQALNGTLRSPATGTTLTSVAFKNATGMAVNMYMAGTAGGFVGFDASGTAAPGKPAIRMPNERTVTLASCVQGSWIVFLCAHTGGFVGAMSCNTSSSFQTLLPSFMPSPNDIGPIPKPTGTTLIPADSPRVVVGCGTLDKGVVVREQFWRLLPQSYSLAPSETKMVGFSRTSGVQQVSSSIKTVAATVGANVSAGWGPFSASVSASLSKNSTSMQEVAVHKIESTYVADTITNTTTQAVMVLFWQLTDVVTVFGADNKPAASIVQGLQPEVLSGPFNPAPPSLDELSDTPVEPMAAMAALDGTYWDGDQLTTTTYTDTEAEAVPA
jgi:hypothetical protein